MIKKVLVFFSILLTGFALLFSTGVVYADEPEPSTDTEEVIEYPCKVVLSTNNGGDVLFDIEEGNVGDIVTAYVKADFLFGVSSVQINGISVEINSDGKYQFALIEGDNIFSVEFKVNNAKLTEIAELINGIKENGFASLFTVNNLLNFITWITSILFTSGFFITLIKSKKLKGKTVDEVVSIVKNTIELENAQMMKDFLEKLIGPSFETITQKMDGMNECMMVFCRCFVLAQDDTPENRLAIINELTKLNNSDEKLTAQIRAIVKEEQKAQEEKIIARDKAIEELKTNNENLVNKEEIEDGYGQL